MSEESEIDDNLVDTTFIPLEIDGYLHELSKGLDREIIVPVVINKIISCFYFAVCTYLDIPSVTRLHSK